MNKKKCNCGDGAGDACNLCYKKYNGYDGKVLAKLSKEELIQEIQSLANDVGRAEMALEDIKDTINEHRK